MASKLPVFSFKVLVSDIVSRYSIEARNKDIGLSIAEDAADCMILADLHLIERAVSNLIENAIRYTDQAGQITATLFEANGHAVFQVSDNGIGIPSEHLGRVFERFYRVDKHRNRATGGSGLGLSICKHIVEAHGENIGVISTEGAGSVFSFSLKCASDL